MELPGIVGDETSRLGQSWKSWARPSAPRTVTLACSLQPAPATPPTPGWYQNVQTRIFLVSRARGSPSQVSSLDRRNCQSLIHLAILPPTD